jgi:TonB family protein
MEVDLTHDSRDAQVFRRNLCIVGAVHLFVLCTLFVIGRWQARIPPTQVLWLDGGGLAGVESPANDSAATDAAPERTDTSEPFPIPEPEPELKQPAEIQPTPPPPPPRSEPEPLPSELVIPRRTPETTPPRPSTPKPATPTPKPATPKPSTPRPHTPKPATPRPETPKPSTPKPATPRRTPAASPKPKASSPTPKPTTEKPGDAAAPATSKSTPTLAKGGTGATKQIAADSGSATHAANGAGKTGNSNANGAGAGKSGRGSGAGANEFAWYYEMLDDRFTSRWEQPLSIVRSTQDFVTTLKIRINKDGTIALREIANSSGNPVMDESVLSAARKVLMVDPLPAGLGGDSFEVNINFKLDQGQ